MMSHVVWHDIECGTYVEDLPLWRDLAQGQMGPVLDAGAGAGRVALDLARRGHSVVAVDRDPDLLAELGRRAGPLPIQTVLADARSFELPGRSFGLILAPMQLVQLLGGFEGRMGFLRAARAHLRPGGLLACAISESMDAFDGTGVLPLPDVTMVDGIRYSSQPVALREEDGRVAIERIREIITLDGRRSSEGDIIHLDRVDSATLEHEGRAAGFIPDRPRVILPTNDHVGSSVVMLRA
jgi:SAM-dependent methyltransferase